MDKVKSPTITIDDNEKPKTGPKLTADFRSNSDRRFEEFNDSKESELQENPADQISVETLLKEQKQILSAK